MKKTALFLDVDGVLNQYRRCERIRRHKIDYDYTFRPFRKKVIRLAKLVKKYNLDVFVFSAWTIENLQPHLPFELKGDTRKWSERVLDIAKNYDTSILIDDELSSGLFGHERTEIPKELIIYQPHYDFGLVLEDFKKIDKMLKELH